MTDALQLWQLSPLWPYALLIITVLSWAIYRFLAPRSWRDWAGASVLQAFVIALYAEMYGFPLTIYFIASRLPGVVPLRHSSGHLWAALLGTGEAGVILETVLGYSLFLAGALLIVKGWVRIYYSGQSLVTTHVYALMRHPQYSGIFLLVIGELIDWPTLPSAVLTPIIVALYYKLARREELKMLQVHGRAYRQYMDNTPMFLPRIEQFF